MLKHRLFSEPGIIPAVAQRPFEKQWNYVKLVTQNVNHGIESGLWKIGNTMQRKPFIRIEVPTKEEVIAARQTAGISQEAAAELVYLKSFNRWSEYERGLRNMDASRYELFLLKTNQHPHYTLSVRRSRSKKDGTPEV